MQEFIEIPASLKSLASRKPLFGRGINDADYVVRPKINGKRESCPYYRVWASIMKRSYCEKYQKTNPTYTGCSVAEEWLTFSRFRAWMKTQEWQNKAIDKDILVPGNKVYGPSSCIFVSQSINNLLCDHAAARGACPQGVSLDKEKGKYESYCGINSKKKHLGYFTTIPAAEHTYLVFKSKLIKSIAYEDEAISNPKLHKALLNHAKLFEDKANKISL